MDIRKAYSELERKVKGKKRLTESQKVQKLRYRIKTLKQKILEKKIERKRVNILAKIEDKIPSTFIKKKEEQSYLGKI